MGEQADRCMDGFTEAGWQCTGRQVGEVQSHAHFHRTTTAVRTSFRPIHAASWW